MASIEEKLCKTCNRVLPKNSDYFYLSGKYFTSPCKECTRERTREWVRENKERKAETDRKYAEKNKERISQYQKIYRSKNINKTSEYHREYSEKNSDKMRERRREYNSRPDVKNRRSERERERKNKDPIYRFNCNIRSAVSESISRNKGALRNLPYTRDELREHIERQFTKGMTWENYGSFWHVDHIIPVSSFNITGPECGDFKACWALTNLRPLKAEKNLSKGDRVTHLI